MQLNFTKFFTLIFVLTLGLCSDSVSAKEAATEIEQSEESQAEESSKVERLKEINTLLANIQQLILKSAELKEVAAKIPDFDQLLFMTLLIDIENDLSSEFDRLISLQQKLDRATPEAQSIHIQLQGLATNQEVLLREEIETLKELIPKLREQANTDPVINLSVERAKQIIFALLVEWQKNIVRQQGLHMNVDASVDDLRKLVQFVAITQTGRIRLNIDTITALNTALKEAGPDDQKGITKNLHIQEMQKNLAVTNLEKMLGIMTELKMDTTKFGQALVLATGKILHNDVKTKAVIGLFKKMVDQAMLWLHDNLSFIIFRIVSFILIILAFRVIASIARRLVNKATAHSKFDTSQLLKDFLGSMAHKIVMLIGFMIALSQLGIEIAPLLAGMGIMGFVIGFALQDTLSNFASGLMILIYRPFDIGNFVDVAGISGEVKQMNLVSTTILTIDNKRLIIPNSKIWGDIITNVTAEQIRRVDFVFGIGYEDDINAAERVLQETVEQHDLILNKPEPIVKLHSLGESSVDFIVRPWVKTADYWTVYWDITRQVKERFDEENISIPYPQRDVHIIQAKNAGPLT